MDKKITMKVNGNPNCLVINVLQNIFFCVPKEVLNDGQIFISFVLKNV